MEFYLNFTSYYEKKHCSKILIYLLQLTFLYLFFNDSDWASSSKAHSLTLTVYQSLQFGSPCTSETWKLQGSFPPLHPP